MSPTAPAITNHAEEKDPAPRIRDSLDELPAELLLKISGTLPSLDALWNLMRASPMIWRLFDCYHKTIIESILSGPNSTTPPKLRKLIRAMVFVRSGQLPFVDLEEFQSFMHSFVPADYLPIRLLDSRTGYSISHRTEVDGTKQNLGPGSLPQATAHTARSVVATAYHISAPSQSLLSGCLARLRDPSFTPLHPPHFENIALVLYHELGSPDDGGTPVPLVDMGQPTWPEEIRVVRAMWVIQMVGELKLCVAKTSETNCWSDREISKLIKNHLLRLVCSCFEPLNEPDFDTAQEVKAAMEYLETRGEYETDIYFRLPRAPKPSADNRWVTGAPRATVSKHLDRSSNEKLLLSVPDVVWQWDLIELTLTELPHGFRFYWPERFFSPRLRRVPFETFHPLGFAFWERRRLNLLGFVLDVTTLDPPDAVCLFAWESIL